MKSSVVFTIWYPVNIKLHCTIHHCCAWFPFTGRLHSCHQIWPLWASPCVFIYNHVSGIYRNWHIYETYVNLIWYLYLYLLNQLRLSITLCLSKKKHCVEPNINVRGAVKSMCDGCACTARILHTVYAAVICRDFFYKLYKYVFRWRSDNCQRQPQWRNPVE